LADKWLPSKGYSTLLHRGDKKDIIKDKVRKPYTLNMTNKRYHADPYIKNKILNFIENYFIQYKTTPSLRKICEGVGISTTSMATKYLEALVDDGDLEHNENEATFNTYVLPLDKIFNLVRRELNERVS
jgi:sulfur relay (sulfurtransferase) DsrC/TusE family protein